jgi:two-component system, OmpR family, KDP operon response regulator KdpE
MSIVNPLVLVVDDESPIRNFLKVALEGQNYIVFEASCGKEALESALAVKPDIILLDLGLPDIDGTEVIRSLRQWTQIPIIILSVRDGERDKINALDTGADDYLTKPFSINELMARLRASLRRAAQIEEIPFFVLDDLKVDIASRVVTVSGAEVSLTPNEYELLKVLVTNAGKVMTQHQLLRQVWGVQYEQEFHLLQVNISNLRHKIEKNPSKPQYILTDAGVGYRMRAA